jgi:hypothetical protein
MAEKQFTKKIPNINTGSNKGFTYGFEPWLGSPAPKTVTSVNTPSVKTISPQIKGGATTTGSQQTAKPTITDVTPKEDQSNTLAKIQKDIDSLKGAFYKNNFSGYQNFTKKSVFTSRLRTPVYATAPTTCEIGELYVNSGTGKLYVCSATNTWSLVGTQS